MTFFRRYLALLLSVSIFSTQCAFVHATEMNLWAERRAVSIPSSTLFDHFPPIEKVVSSLQKFPSSLKLFARAVPQTRASIQEYYSSDDPQGPAVVIIQDIHLNGEAQKNIASVLQSLIASCQIGVIGIEGAFRSFDFSPFKLLPDQHLLRLVAESFFHGGKLMAASYVGVTSNVKTPLFVGVDNKAHYDLNVKAYLDSQLIKSKAWDDLNHAQQILDVSKKNIFSPKHVYFDQLYSDYHENRIGIGAYVAALVDLGVKLNSHLSHFSEVIRLESSLNFKQVDVERRIILNSLTEKLTRSEMADLTEHSMLYRLGKIGLGAYYRHLKTLCSAKGVNLNQKQAFNNYVRYVLLSESIQSKNIFDHLDQLEQKLFSDLSRTPEQRILINESRRLLLAKKLVNLSLTPAEWKAYQNLRARTPGSIHLDPFEKFYTAADIRSHSMVENLLAHSKSSNSMVLLAGGFHSPLVGQLLREKKISYVIITPKLTKVNRISGNDYLSVLAREKTPLDKIFQGEKVCLKPQIGEIDPDSSSGPQLMASTLARMGPSALEEAPYVDFPYAGHKLSLKVNKAADPSADTFNLKHELSVVGKEFVRYHSPFFLVTLLYPALLSMFWGQVALVVGVVVVSFIFARNHKATLSQKILLFFIGGVLGGVMVSPSIVAWAGQWVFVLSMGFHFTFNLFVWAVKKMSRRPFLLRHASWFVQFAQWLPKASVVEPDGNRKIILSSDGTRLGILKKLSDRTHWLQFLWAPIMQLRRESRMDNPFEISDFQFHSNRPFFSAAQLNEEGKATGMILVDYNADVIPAHYNFEAPIKVVDSSFVFLDGTQDRMIWAIAEHNKIQINYFDGVGTLTRIKTIDFVDPDDSFSEIKLSDDGTTLFTKTKKGCLKMWETTGDSKSPIFEIPSKKQNLKIDHFDVSSYQNHNPLIFSSIDSEQGAQRLLVALEKMVFVSDLKTGEMLGEGYLLHAPPTHVCLSADGRFFAVAIQNEVQLWNIALRQMVQKFSFESHIQSLTLSRDGTHFAVVVNEAVILEETKFPSVAAVSERVNFSSEDWGFYKHTKVPLSILNQVGDALARWLSNLLGEAGFIGVAFKEGMRFKDTINWWGYKGARAGPLQYHTGLDFSVGTKSDGSHEQFKAGQAILAMKRGKVVGKFEDSMGETLIVASGEFIVFYTHILVATNKKSGKSYAIGDEVEDPDLIGYFTNPRNDTSTTSRHLHLGTGRMKVEHQSRLENLTKGKEFEELDQMVLDGILELYNPEEFFDPEQLGTFETISYGFIDKTILVHPNKEITGVFDKFRRLIGLRYPGIAMPGAITEEKWEKLIEQEDVHVVVVSDRPLQEKLAEKYKNRKIILFLEPNFSDPDGDEFLEEIELIRKLGPVYGKTVGHFFTDDQISEEFQIDDVLSSFDDMKTLLQLINNPALLMRYLPTSFLRWRFLKIIAEKAPWIIQLKAIFGETGLLLKASNGHEMNYHPPKELALADFVSTMNPALTTNQFGWMPNELLLRVIAPLILLLPDQMNLSTMRRFFPPEMEEKINHHEKVSDLLNAESKNIGDLIDKESPSVINIVFKLIADGTSLGLDQLLRVWEDIFLLESPIEDELDDEEDSQIEVTYSLEIVSTEDESVDEVLFNRWIKGTPLEQYIESITVVINSPNELKGQFNLKNNLKGDLSVISGQVRPFVVKANQTGVVTDILSPGKGYSEWIIWSILNDLKQKGFQTVHFSVNSSEENQPNYLFFFGDENNKGFIKRWNEKWRTVSVNDPIYVSSDTDFERWIIIVALQQFDMKDVRPTEEWLNGEIPAMEIKRQHLKKIDAFAKGTLKAA
ncbi:MAG: hypothetical protein ACKVQC_02760 [Elusimicrobiota bacterium]